MDNNFNYKPQPGDWELPEELKESMDPTAYAVLSETELEGVPVGVGFQASKDYARVFDLLESESDPTVILAEIEAVRTPWEQRYPGAAMWDRIHGHIAVQLAGNGHADAALGLLSTIVSPYEKLARVGDIADLETGVELDLDSMVESLMNTDDDAKRYGLTRALRDRMIDRALEPEMVDQLDQILMNTGVEANPMTGWIESRKIADPRIDWSFAEDIAGEDIWPETMPTFWKRYILLAVTEGLEQIGKGENSLDADDAIGIIDDFDKKYGDARVWDQLKVGFVIKSYAKNELENAMKIALSIKDNELIGSIAVTLAQRGHQESAMELAAINPNPKIAVELLLEIGWDDEEMGVRKIMQLVQDETLPAQRRIAMMETIRDRFTESNALDLAVKWQDMIDEVKESE